MGLIIRRTLPETFEAPSATGRMPFTPELWRLAFLGVVLLSTITTAYFVIDYMTTFAEDTLHISPTTAFAATVALGLTGMCFDVLGGVLSDRFGRKPIVLGTGVVYILAIFPAYYAIVHLGSAAALIIGAGLLGALQGLYAPPILIGITEGLPHEIRSGALSLIYAIGVSVFGASTQFAVKGVIKLTGSSFAPAGFMIVAITIGVIAMLFVRETAPVKIGKHRA